MFSFTRPGLREYKKDHWWHTTAGLWGIYVIFKIFGPFGAGTSMVLSVLIGALYDEWAEPNTLLGQRIMPCGRSRAQHAPRNRREGPHRGDAGGI
eukprot:g21051.t1